MNKKVLVLAVLGALAGTAQAASFIGGGFESGTLNGWSENGGTVTAPAAVNQYTYTGTPNNTVVGVGVDAITGLSTVKYGNYAAKINDAQPYQSFSTISQSVLNYDSNSINFSWAAVL